MKKVDNAFGLGTEVRMRRPGSHHGSLFTKQARQRRDANPSATVLKE